MKTNYFKRIVATALAALSMMSIIAAGSVTASAANTNTVISANNQFDKNSTWVEIPDSVTEIKDNAFKDFKRLEKVVIGKNVKTISPTAFIGCPGILSFSVKQGNQYFSVDSGIYLTDYSYRGSDMRKLIRVATGELKRTGKRYEIPRYFSEIGEYAFESAFTESDYLKELRIENEVIAIDAHAFEGCQIENIVIGKNVRYIGAYAFSGNKMAETVNLTYNLNAVGDFAFTGCDNLSKITYNNPKMLVGLDWNGNAKTVMSNPKEVIAFDVNGGDIFSIPDNIEFDTHSMNNELIYTNVEPVRSGCVLAGWTDENNNFYRPNSRLKKNVSTLLRAKWEGKTQAVAEKTTEVRYYVKKAETTTANNIVIESAQNKVPETKKIFENGNDTPVRIDETTTKAAPETTTKAVEKTTTAVADVTEKSRAVTVSTTGKRSDDTVEINANKYIDESYSIVTAARRSADDNTESTTAATAEATARTASSAKKTEGGKKLNVFQRLIAFIKSLFSKKG